MGCACSTTAHESGSLPPDAQNGGKDDNNLLRNAGKKNPYAKHRGAPTNGATGVGSQPQSGGAGASTATADSDVIVLATGRPFSPIFALSPPPNATISSANGGGGNNPAPVPNTSTSDDPPTTGHHLSGASAGAAGPDGLISPRGRKILIRRLASPGPSATLSRPSNDGHTINSPGLLLRSPGQSLNMAGGGPSFAMESPSISSRQPSGNAFTTHDQGLPPAIPASHVAASTSASPHRADAITTGVPAASAAPPGPSTHPGPLYGGSVHPISNFSTYSTFTAAADAATLAGTGGGGGGGGASPSLSPVSGSVGFSKHIGSSPQCMYIAGSVGIPIAGGHHPSLRPGSSAGSAGGVGAPLPGAVTLDATKSRSPVRVPEQPTTPTVLLAVE